MVDGPPVADSSAGTSWGTWRISSRLDLSYNWGLSGPLPPSLQLSRLEKLEIFVTQACVPAAAQDWLETIEFLGQVCGSGTDVTIDVAIVHTPAAREAAGGTAAIAAEVDVWIAEANQAFEASGVDHRLALVARSGVAYNETGNSLVDINRLANPSDGHMDDVHALRDRVGADLVYLIVSDSDAARGYLGGPFGLTCQHCGGGSSRMRWGTTWDSRTTGTRCTTTKAGCRRIRRTAT